MVVVVVKARGGGSVHAFPGASFWIGTPGLGSFTLDIFDWGEVFGRRGGVLEWIGFVCKTLSEFPGWRRGTPPRGGGGTLDPVRG